VTGDVTVVIAAHDASATIDAALASVVAQTAPPVAVIVVDDASSDDTVARVENWRDRLPLTVERFPENRGPSAARNAGVSLASTELVAFLDADDYWLPEHLEQMRAAYADGGAIVTADVLRWIPGRALSTRTLADRLPVPAPAEQLVALYRRNFVHSAALVPRADYLAVGGMRTELRHGEDWDLWIRLVRRGLHVRRPPQPTVLYRLHAATLSDREADQVEGERRVLELAMADASSEAERAAIRRGIRRVGAQADLFAAYRAATIGDVFAARRHALAVLTRGRADAGRRVAVRATALVVAPRWGAAQRAARRHRPRWWLSRA
jgi:glycosyltransferase involved in cell wall biosynthesis